MVCAGKSRDGEIVFQDSTFLPGTLTLKLFGHMVEFLPRVMIIDRREVPWASNATTIVK